MSSVEKEFLALSNNDFVFWGNEASKDYYNYNLELIRKGVVIKRIFAIPRERFSDTVIHEAILRQIKDEIRVGVISTEQLQSLTMGVWEADFAIHDDFAVSFFRPYRHRVYRVITEFQKIKRYRELHSEITKHSQDVPGKNGEDSKLFQNEGEFTLWVEKINAPSS